MAKFKGKDLYLAEDDQIYFGDNQEAAMWYDVDSELHLNHTLSGIRAVQPYHMVRYDQLTETSGILQDQIDNLEIDIENQNEFIELIDTPASYAGWAGYSAVVNEAEDGIAFELPTPGTTVTGILPPPVSGTNLWYNGDDHQLYYYDFDREDWLSIMSHYYMFTVNGAATGSYMAIGNVTHSSVYYYIPRTATIVSISSSAQKSQESEKGFDVETVASGTIFTFFHTNWTYRDNTINVPLDEEDELKCYVQSAGQPVRNVIVTLEIKWRYEAP